MFQQIAQPSRVVGALAAIVAVAAFALPQAAGAAVPVTRTWSAKNQLVSSDQLNGVACPSQTECVAVDEKGNEVTFNPQSPGSPSPVDIDSTNDITGVACPPDTPTQCTAVDYFQNEVTFNPTSGAVISSKKIDTTANTNLWSVACPLQGQCTAVDLAGDEVTFDPTKPGSPTPVQIDSNGALAIACSLSSQCTAVDNKGNEETFNPGSPPAMPSPVTVDSGNKLNALACPSQTQCSAVDSSGNIVTFDPTSTSNNVTASGLIDSGVALNGVDCPTTGDCVAVDASGNALEGNPAPANSSPVTFGSKAVTGGGGMPSVSCSSQSQCVAVDYAGNAYVGTLGLLEPLTVSLQGSGSGTVSSSPAGIYCPSTCEANYASGTQVTLTATPASGSTFDGWSGGGCSGTGTCSVAMSQSQAVTATFTATGPPPPQTLSVSLAGSGSGSVASSPPGISCQPTCSAQFAQGAVVTLTATPASGSTFSGWSGGGCSGTGTCAVTMSSAQAVSATFNQGGSGTARVPSSVVVECTYPVKAGVDFCRATVEGGSPQPSGQVRFMTSTPGTFLVPQNAPGHETGFSSNPCTLSFPSTSATSASCGVEFKPSSSTLTTIAGLVLHATYLGDNHYLPSSGKAKPALVLPPSGRLQTVTTATVSALLNDGGVVLNYDNPHPGGTIDITIAESGSQATHDVLSMRLSRRVGLRGKLVIARLHRGLVQAGPVRLDVKLTAKGRKLLRQLKRRHERQVKTIFAIVYKAPHKG